jgi:hypothetical protein
MAVTTPHNRRRSPGRPRRPDQPCRNPGIRLSESPPRPASLGDAIARRKNPTIDTNETLEDAADGTERRFDLSLPGMPVHELFDEVIIFAEVIGWPPPD